MYKEPLEIKTTAINKNWHVRLYCNGTPKKEVVCTKKIDMGSVIKQLLRWYDKLGNHPYSKMADASRNRNKTIGSLQGKVWEIKII